MNNAPLFAVKEWMHFIKLLDYHIRSFIFPCFISSLDNLLFKLFFTDAFDVGGVLSVAQNHHSKSLGVIMFNGVFFLPLNSSKCKGSLHEKLVQAAVNK